MNKQKNKQIEAHYQQAYKIALGEVERCARQILKRHPHIDEFVMCMGTWFFTLKNHDWYIHDGDSYKYLDPLQEIFDEWDHYLKLTGTPMRFTATSEITTDW